MIIPFAEEMPAAGVYSTPLGIQSANLNAVSEGVDPQRQFRAVAVTAIQSHPVQSIAE
jgi:hypothetical protein